MEQETQAAKVYASNSVLSCDAAGPDGAGGPGNCTVLIDQIVAPLCPVEMSGAIRTQTRSSDGVNLNLVASSAATLARSSRRTAGEGKRDPVGR